MIRTGKPQFVHDITDGMLVLGARDSEHLALLRAVGLNSTMIAPIRTGDRIVGALSFASSTSRRFDARDLELACDLGRQAGVFIESAQLSAAQTHIARTLQAGLVPHALPSIEGWTVSSAYRAAGRAYDVGGDFHDIVVFDGGWAAIIGDVVGKGATAVGSRLWAAIRSPPWSNRPAIWPRPSGCSTVGCGNAAGSTGVCTPSLRDRHRRACRRRQPR